MVIRAGAVEVFASVVWSRRDECGIVFDEPLDEVTLEALKLEGACATASIPFSR